MRFVSLFAGVGGFDLAFERAGMDCVGQVEIDKNCRQVLAHHWPNVPKWEDIHDVTADRLLTASRTEGEGTRNSDRTGSDVGRLTDHPGDLLHNGDIRSGRGSVDVLCGGFPCQDYSVAGKRGGLAGDRGALWWQFHRLIAECRPEWVVGENVPGLLSSNNGRDFGAIVGSLVELGYGVTWRILDAQYFGVAQRRRRVFIVGHSGGQPRPEILSLAEGCAGDTPPVRTAWQAASPTLAARINGGGGLGTDHDLDGGLIAFNWQSGGDVRLSVREKYTDALHSGQVPAVAFTQNTRDEVRDLHDLAGALAAQPGMKQTTYLAFTSKDSGADAGALAPTLRSMNYDQSHVNGGGQVAVASPSSVRRLTPLECERLQGFPDNWTACQSDTQRYRQMGNAVAVPVAEWIGQNLVKADYSKA